MMSSLNSKKRAFSWVVSLHIATILKINMLTGMIWLIRYVLSKFFFSSIFFYKRGFNISMNKLIFVELVFEWHIIFAMIFFTGTYSNHNVFDLISYKFGVIAGVKFCILIPKKGTFFTISWF